MTNYRPFTTLAVLFAALLLSLTASAQPEELGEPVGTVTITAKEFSLIISGVKGQGTLYYQGEEHPFTLKGGGYGVLSATKIDAEGEVYRLNNIDDFPGMYTTAAASAAAGSASVGAAYVQNNKGVVMRLRAKQQGVSLSVGQDLISIEFVK